MLVSPRPPSPTPFQIGKQQRFGTKTTKYIYESMDSVNAYRERDSRSKDRQACYRTELAGWLAGWLVVEREKVMWVGRERGGDLRDTVGNLVFVRGYYG